MTNAPRTLNEELEKMKANYRRQDEIRKSLAIATICYELTIRYLKRTCSNYHDLSQDIKSLLSIDGLPEDTRAEAEEKLAVAEANHREVQAEMEKEERKFDERMKPLLDELNALDIEMRQ